MTKPIEMWMLRTEALRVFKNIVKHELRSKGFKLSSFTYAELTRMTKGYLQLNRKALIGQALGSLAWSRLCSELKNAAPIREL